MVELVSYAPLLKGRRLFRIIWQAKTPDGTAFLPPSEMRGFLPAIP